MRGGSAIIGPDGQYIAGPVYDEPTILTAELSLERVREESMSLDVAGHYGRRDCFDFAVRPRDAVRLILPIDIRCIERAILAQCIECRGEGQRARQPAHDLRTRVIAMVLV